MSVLPGAITDLLSLGGGAVVSAALAALPQADRPIVLLLMDGGGLRWGHWITPKPEDLAYRHPTRATPIHTLGGAYVDDFGAGIVEISLQGSTGYKMGLLGSVLGSAAGDVMMFNLRNWIMMDYHQAREAAAAAGRDPQQIQLLLVDALNMAMYVVYPMDFQLRRSVRSPLLYRYNMRLIGLERLL